MPRASFFLRITDAEGGEIKGEAQEHDFDGAIEVTQWDWAVSDKKAKEGTQGDAASGGKSAGGESRGAREGEAGEQSYLPTPLRFSKATDRATTRLLYAMINGETLQSAIFTLRQQWRVGTGGGREKDDEFKLHLQLYDVRVTSYDFNARASSFDVELDEDWVFSYRRIQFNYESAPGEYAEGSEIKKGPGLFPEFFLPAGSTTKALKKPEMTNKEMQKRIDEQQAEIDRLRRSKSAPG